MTFYIDTKKAGSAGKISWFLKKCILNHSASWRELVFLCIGTDRLTGDCLGPYVGQQLTRQLPGKFHIYGTLSHPVHALNLCDTSSHIIKRHPQALVVAIDASLGQKKHLGYVGDIHITGIVNTAGIMEQLTLQTTRLSTVISLADKITEGILAAVPCSVQNSCFIQKL